MSTQSKNPHTTSPFKAFRQSVRSSLQQQSEAVPESLGPLAFFVDLDQYMGDWYVIAHIPTPFEAGAVNAVESYRWNDAEKRIDILYHHNQDHADGPLRQFPQKAWIVDPQSNAEWKVQFFWPLKFSYRILDVASDYSWAVVGTNSKNFVWILSRRTHLDEDVFEDLMAKIAAWGYDIRRLRKVPQVWDSVS